MEESPLHPFELHNYIPINVGGLDLSINKAVIMMWVVVVLVTALMLMAAHARQLVPGKLQNIAEWLVEFIRGIILDTMGQDGMRFFPLIGTLFLFIFYCNVLGLIPGTYTVTSQLVVTAAFAVFVYGLSLVLGFFLHGARFLGILIPPGTPVWMLPLMVPIELVSQLARPISLAVRLFANMTAGHTVLAVLFGMVITMPLIPLPLPVRFGLLILLVVLLSARRRIIAFAGTWGLVGLILLGLALATVIWIRWIPFVFTVVINAFEIFIAFMQAYIFTTLTCVYLGDAITLHGHSEHEPAH